ncbi:HNH endonuclease signature motif containing protein [Defluviimonas aestuarii]|uniref:HNH endonuclease n=1 Tax=Albidovulum aestuarii TaxID=1130726 RepID=UPI002499E984|nr:HNH endonuclease signature motif containing protein [Defluviimonas aestuarii]MDI3337946.1 HNH endonuclease signature motif containing protein [Defluviimonas aestuarii]
MRRAFTPRQRRVLRMLAGNLCQKCGAVLDADFHADHVRAHSRGGPTILENGQALCASCNLKKGASHDDD